MADQFYLDIPGVTAEGIFGPPPDDWPEPENALEIRAALDWFTSFMKPGEWEKRRVSAARRLYSSALGEMDPSGKGRFFDESDTFGWYLFLGEALIRHPWNYEPMFGSRIVPVLIAIGRNLGLLKCIPGADQRAARVALDERRQPNGGLFELLVAAAYARAGGDVAFVPERKGGPQTHDLDVVIGGQNWAVECKRMETSDYGEAERSRMRDLWGPSASYLSSIGRSLIATVDFLVEIEDVPDNYLTHKVQEYLASDKSSLIWFDRIAAGSIGYIDLQPLQDVLEKDEVLITSTRMQELLTGIYQPHARMLTLLRTKRKTSPRYASACDMAVVLRWECIADASISAKARDILRHLARALPQLPNGRPGVVHMGIEAVDGEAVERTRLTKVLSTLESFDPEGKALEYVYCHYFAPESPPTHLFDFEETAQWRAIRPVGTRPLVDASLVIPANAGRKDGFLWGI